LSEVVSVDPGLSMAILLLIQLIKERASFGRLDARVTRQGIPQPDSDIRPQL
jgi:hypothetical protein